MSGVRFMHKYTKNEYTNTNTQIHKYTNTNTKVTDNEEVLHNAQCTCPVSDSHTIHVLAKTTHSPCLWPIWNSQTALFVCFVSLASKSLWDLKPLSILSRFMHRPIWLLNIALANFYLLLFQSNNICLLHFLGQLRQTWTVCWISEQLGFNFCSVDT